MKSIHVVTGNEYHTRMLEDYHNGVPGMHPLALVFGADDEEAEERACVLGAAYDMLAFCQGIVKGDYGAGDLNQDYLHAKAQDILREIGVL